MVTLEEAQKRYPGASTFQFGDTPELIEELTALVRSGRKRAACCAVADIEAERESAPELGRRDIALDARGRPALVIETLELRETTFREMTEEMALAEGEGGTLEGWRIGHRRVYGRQGYLRIKDGSDDMRMRACLIGY